MKAAIKDILLHQNRYRVVNGKIKEITHKSITKSSTKQYCSIKKVYICAASYRHSFTAFDLILWPII